MTTKKHCIFLHWFLAVHINGVLFWGPAYATPIVDTIQTLISEVSTPTHYISVVISYVLKQKII